MKYEHVFDSLSFELLLEAVLKAKNTHLYTQTRWRSELPEGPYYGHFGKGVGCEALSIITDSLDFPKL